MEIILIYIKIIDIGIDNRYFEYVIVMENSMWLIGIGRKILFWNDNWFGEPLN